MISRTEKDPKQTRYMNISQFTTEINFLKGDQNVVADTFSRIESEAIDFATPSYETLVETQKHDQELGDLIESGNISRPSMKLEFVRILASSMRVWCEVSQGRNRPFVPSELRLPIFRAIHELSHPGVRATRTKISQLYFWPNMNKEVGEWAQNCLECQKQKVTRHTKPQIQRIPIPEGRFKHIHIDLVGPLPISNGFRYLLTTVDRYTRWPEAYPLEDIQAQTVARCFISNYVSRFGVPEEITTDQGSQFESKLFNELSKLLGSKRLRTTAYHPQANGMVERFHRQLKAALRTYDSAHWSESLPLVLLGIRTTIKRDLGHTPAEMLYGENLRVPGEFFVASEPTKILDPSEFVDRLRKSFEQFRSQPTRVPETNQIYVPEDLKTCDFVFVRVDKVKTGLTAPYEGPFEVVKRFRKVYIIRQGGKETKISVDRLKPAKVERCSEETRKKRKVRFKETS